MMIASREHEFSYGHRVVGHEGKCKQLHGHNATVIFSCIADYHLDAVGRVIDFSVIKSTLCQWLEDHWDHKMLLWEEDPMLNDPFPVGIFNEVLQSNMLVDVGIVEVPFNPTAENMAKYLVDVVGPLVLPVGVKLIGVEFFETRKCSVLYKLDGY